MAPRFIPNEIREIIRERCDIVDVIGSYIQLKNMGKTWKACCPFHQEKTPSFTVSPERQSFHCFGCGAGGDVFKFVMMYENVDFTTAGILLAERAQVIIPEETRFQSKDDTPLSQHKDRFYEIYETLCTFYQKQLVQFPDSTVAQYLSTRHLPPEVIEKFRIGAAPNAWEDGVNLLRKLGFTDEEIKLSGVVSESEKNPGKLYDRFRNRLIFPIWNEQGRVVAFSARKVVEEEGGGKYVNSPESPVFKKSKTLYALPFARREIPKHLEGAILCEGQLDTIAMHRAGFENTIAPQGTAFTHEQAALIKRQTDRLCLGLDADSAGIEATLRCIEIALPLGFDIKVIRFPGGKDPDELFRKQGFESIHDAVHQAIDFSQFLIDYFSQKFDIKSPTGRSRIANGVLQYIAKIPNDIAIASHAENLAQHLKLPIDAIRTELNLIRAKNASHSRTLPQEPPYHSPLEELMRPASRALSAEEKKMLTAEKEMLKLVIEYADAAQAVAENIPLEYLSDTVEGHAIAQIVQLHSIGQWSSRIQVLQDTMLENPDSNLSQYLVESTEKLTLPFIKKAISQTVFTFNEAHLTHEINRILANWKAVQGDPEASKTIQEEYQTYQRELTNIRKIFNQQMN